MEPAAARKYIYSLVCQRLKLYKMGKSYNPSAVKDAMELKKLMDYNGYYKAGQIYAFVKRHYYKLLNIIPGGQSPTHNTIKQRLSQIYNH